MNHYEIVRRLIDSKAVDFNAIGKFISENGASIAMSDEPNICGTGRYFIHLFRVPGLGNQVPGENFKNLSQVGAEIR